jgi:chitinase
MASRRHQGWCLLLLAFLLSLQLAAARNRNDDVAVYWGRDRNEGSLRETCDTGRYTTVMISFLAAFGRGRYHLDLSGHRFAGVGADIKHCQRRGVLVLLSIGGPGRGYSLPTSRSAKDVAELLWNAFLGGYRADVPRPFGNAEVDGIDFFIEHGGRWDHYDELARRLHAYNSWYYRRNNRRSGVTLTATPGCRYPDRHLDGALATGLFSRIHVRLFGDDRWCVWSSSKAWEKWAKSYPRTRVFVGVVASPDRKAARAGYIPPWYLHRSLLQFAQRRRNYGGVMVWNRYYDRKTGYTSRSNL